MGVSRVEILRLMKRQCVQIFATISFTGIFDSGKSNKSDLYQNEIE